MDFEQGTFNNWSCRIGTLDGVGNITWSPATVPIPNRHEMIASSPAVDPYGNFPLSCPNGSNYQVKIGNNNAPPGLQATEVSYTYTIPPGAPVFSILFWYAIVLKDPSNNHTNVQRPRFKARIFDITTNTPVPCVDFDFISSASLPGFRQSPFDPTVIFKDWTPVSIDLSGLAGHQVKLEFTSYDCTLGGHFGYAYVDVNSTCNGAITGTNICQGDNSVTLNAPYGFQSYEWYSDNTFTTLLGTSQSLPLNPAPAVGTVMPVIVIPFPTFGCRDTLYATISVSPKPISRAGPDIAICKFAQVQLGAPPVPGLQYDWRPSALVNNPALADPLATATPPGPAELIVHTTDILTGCWSEDTVLVSIKTVDTAISRTGPGGFCIGENTATLSVHNGLTAIQWYDGTNPIAGATAQTYVPSSSGLYWAQVQQNGCTDTTATIPISVHPLPVVAFIPDDDTSCVTSNQFTFTNSSTAPDGSALTFDWYFSNGTHDQVFSPVKTFTQTGVYTVKLVATSAFQCKDSTSDLVYVLPNGVPGFTWDSVCTNRPVQFTNLSNENGSAQTNYTWSFGDGNPDVVVKNPPPVIYASAGTVDVRLQLVNLGCEHDPKIVTQKVQVNPQHTPVRYHTFTIPEGASKFIHVRDSVGKQYTWTPRVQLSAYDQQYTEFIATGSDVEYLIKITDQHTCVTVDTMLLQVLKKKGYYLPTGFTPNGDGLNDVVRPYLVGMKGLKNFSVFNRWGNLVFQTNREGEGWNGKLNGEDLDSGVYIWMLEFYDADNRVVNTKGTVTLIR